MRAYSDLPKQGDARSDRSAQRSRILRKNVFAGVASRIATALIGLLVVPLTVFVLGKETYGTFVAISAVAGWTQVGTLGLGKGLMNALVDCHARDDRELARRYVASLWGGLGVVITALALALAAVFPFVSWRAVFAVSVAETSTLNRALAVTVVSALVALLVSPAAIILSAYQEERTSSAWGIARALATIVAVGFAAARDTGLVGVCVATGAASVVVGTANAIWVLRWHKPFLWPRAGDVSWELVKKVLPSSAEFFAIDLAALFVFQVDKILLLHFAGPSQVADYDVAVRLFFVAQSLLGLVLTPLWPALGEALRTGDGLWATKALRRVSGWSAFLMGVLALAATLFGSSIAQIWTRNPAFEPPRILFAVLGAYFSVRAWTDTHTILLYSADKQRDMIWVAAIHGALNVLFALTLGPRLGSVGVAAAGLLGFVLSAGWYVPWRARRTLAHAVGQASCSRS